jgi:hypothetical protein
MPDRHIIQVGCNPAVPSPKGDGPLPETLMGRERGCHGDVVGRRPTSRRCGHARAAFRNEVVRETFTSALRPLNMVTSRLWQTLHPPSWSIASPASLLTRHGLQISGRNR